MVFYNTKLMEVFIMKKNLFKVVASCAAVCFVSGLVLLNGTADTSKASDEIGRASCRERVCQYV